VPHERRRHTRKQVDLPTHYQLAGGERIAAHLADISIGGAYVDHVPKAPPFGTNVILWVVIPGSKELSLEAVVRWLKPGGMGLQFGMHGAKETYVLTEYMRTLPDAPPAPGDG
jgi:type IV pilus assembly protein PilZ